MVGKTHRLRVLLVAFGSLLIFCGIEVRLFFVQVRQHQMYADKAQRQQLNEIKVHPRRGDILDRREQILATSTFYDTVYFNPVYLKGKKDEPPRQLPPDLPRDLAQLFSAGENGGEEGPEERELRITKAEARIRKSLAKTRRKRLQRGVPPETVMAMRLLIDHHEIPRRVFSFEKQSERLYPHDELASAILGFTGIDEYGENVGLGGVEHRYDRDLGGELTTQTIRVNSWHQRLAPMDESILKESFGTSLVLTLDSEIQHFTQKILREQALRVEAESAVVVVLEVKTGAVLAMASYPEFDPNKYSKAAKGSRRNRALTDPIEIGSVMKILTTAILIDNDLVSVDEFIDCQNGSATFEGKRLRDSHRMGVVPFHSVFAESSNIGMATVAQRLDPALYYTALRNFGLGQRTGIDLPGESRGILRPFAKWQKLSRVFLPIGYESSMSAIQVASAVAAVGNEGRRMRPYVVQRKVSAEGRVLERTEPLEIGRVAGAQTSRIVLALMREAVEEGTGKNAKVAGYSVAGKTGTTRKTEKRDKRAYIASFAGLLPAEEPQVAIYCYVNEPNPKIGFYGGQVAAPVFAAVGEAVARILEIPPDLEMEPSESQKNDPSGSPVRHPDRPELQFAEGGVSEGDGFENGAEVFGFAAGSISEEDWMAIVQAHDLSEGDRIVPRFSEPGAMPNCFGRTIPEVLKQFSDSRVPFKIFGSGIVDRQWPAPGERVPDGRQAVIVFVSPSQRNPALRAARFARAEDFDPEDTAPADSILPPM